MIRDISHYGQTAGTTAIVNHIQYDSYGNIVAETNPSDPEAEPTNHLLGFTSRPFDEATGLQNNLNRWYDAAIRQWLTEDPIGFEAGDPNLHRYVANSPLDTTDPSGLDPPYSMMGPGSHLYNSGHGSNGSGSLVDSIRDFFRWRRKNLERREQEYHERHLADLEFEARIYLQHELSDREYCEYLWSQIETDALAGIGTAMTRMEDDLLLHATGLTRDEAVLIVIKETITASGQEIRRC